MEACPNCGFVKGEEWVPVPETNGKYSVTKDGKVRSHIVYSSGRLLKPVVGSHGYPVIGVSYPNGNRVTVPIHALVARTFLGPRPDGAHINHKDGNKLNSNLDNLEYISASANHVHAGLNGLMQRGEDRYNSKLTAATAANIRASDEHYSVLAARYGVSSRTIYDVRQGRTWKWVS